MQTVRLNSNEETRWGLLTSLCTHILLITLLSFLRASNPQVAPLEERIPVEIWTPEQLEAVTSTSSNNLGSTGAGLPPALSPTTEPDYNATLPAPKAVESSNKKDEPLLGPPGMVAAKKILSQDVLANPLSRKMRQILTLFEEDTRLDQLCGIEAMAQIAGWNKEFLPDRVVSYALADLRVTDNTLVAEGAAVHSKGRWYKLKFKCEFDAKRQSVTAFEFMVGASIPKRSWERYNLYSEWEAD